MEELVKSKYVRGETSSNSADDDEKNNYAKLKVRLSIDAWKVWVVACGPLRKADCNRPLGLKF